MKLLLKLPVWAHLWSEPPRGGRGSLCLLQGIFFFFLWWLIPKGSSFLRGGSLPTPTLIPVEFRDTSCLWGPGKDRLADPSPVPRLAWQGPRVSWRAASLCDSCRKPPVLGRPRQGTKCHWCEGLHHILLLLLFEGLWKPRAY